MSRRGPVGNAWQALVLGCLLVSSLTTAQASAQTLPGDFSDTLVAAVPSPTALAFTPDGRLLVASQLGRMYVYRNGVLVPQPAMILAGTCTENERGLLGLAVDPSFASSSTFYAYYTVSTSGGCVNRVSAFTLTGADTVDPASERILVDRIPSPGANHNAGDLHVGRDGYLYISVGDGGCDYNGDSGCGGENNASRDSHVLLGKILRITLDGGIPPTNPYRGADSARCNVTGRTDPGWKCQETFASGLRNPFRIAFDPNAADTRFFINDVGQGVYEEIDLGQVGADYGWNTREGFCVQESIDCSPPPPSLTNPIHAYGRETGCAAITGGAFVPNGFWPATYDNAYLFADYVCGTIFKLTYNGTSYQRTAFVSGLGSSSATAMTFGPYNGGQALYYLSYAGGGMVRRIHYTGGTNRAPSASIVANPTSGPLPLTVSFDGRKSVDPDGGPLTFDWDFGDNTARATTETVVHTYSSAGLYTATLTVGDPAGATGTASIAIDAGNRAPTVVITSPATSVRFEVGQTITLQGQASDPEDGALPPSALLWTVTLHHDTHTHPYLPPTTGNGVSFQAPSPEDFAAAATSYLEIRLTVTDSHGLTTTISQDLLPGAVNLTFATEPPGLKVDVNGSTLTGPRTVVSWDGYTLNLSAPAQRDGNGQLWVFQSWSDGGAAQHPVVTPATAPPYTARFVRGPAVPPGLVAAYALDEGTGSVAIDATGAGNAGAISGAAWTAGKNGRALAFDGANGFVNVADHPSLELAATGTVEAWVRLDMLNRWNGVIAKAGSNADAQHNYGIEIDPGNRANCVVGNGTAYAVAQSSTTFVGERFYHLACVWEPGQLRLYVDGVLNRSIALSITPAGNGGSLSVGQYGVNVDRLQGAVDDIRVYNRALTAAEIQADMALPVGSSRPAAPSAPTGVLIVR